jgi:hypothetical protein
LALFIDLAKSSYQTRLIYGANLVKHNLSALAAKLAVNSGGVAYAFGGHWHDNHSPDETIHLVWRNYQAWSHLLYLATDCKIEIDEVDIEALYYHCQSV